MMRKLIARGCVLVALATALYLARHDSHDTKRQASEATVANSVADAKQEEQRTGTVRTDVSNPDFVNKVLPSVRQFFASLDRAGVNPLKSLDTGAISSIQFMPSHAGISCRFVIDNQWTMFYKAVDKSDELVPFSRIMHFGQRGPDNPFRAIGHADTNALSRLSQGAVAMPQQNLEKIIESVVGALAIDRSKYDKPEIYPEALFDYDLGLQTVRYRLKGSDPINQLNYARTFTLKPTSSTSAVLVSYSNLDPPSRR
jgi:hypothetical protein